MQSTSRTTEGQTEVPRLGGTDTRTYLLFLISQPCTVSINSTTTPGTAAWILTSRTEQLTSCRKSPAVTRQVTTSITANCPLGGCRSHGFQQGNLQQDSLLCPSASAFVTNIPLACTACVLSPLEGYPAQLLWDWKPVKLKLQLLRGRVWRGDGTTCCLPCHNGSAGAHCFSWSQK